MTVEKTKISTELHIMINIVRAMYKTLEEDWTKQAKKYGLTSPQEHLMWVLYFRDGSTITEIANVGLWHISTAMHLIDKLEEKGLVRKERLWNDKRASRIFLTKEGHDLQSKLLEDDYSSYKLYTIMQEKKDAFGLEWEQLTKFGKAVVQDLYGKEYTDFLDASAKQIKALEEKEKES
ncbi:MarR family transcriptional regulator [Ammoniphilus resinae]|uniref:MarR family protease production transcriptional regulator HPr n=1 Tax=Ammoniphilus resinae TaxID=861532 RepID=A0ABS4GRE7_9BACL|nr:MarR family transcriptional regulator [Ammoniphilus resinae]MBP1932850.1 MarR family protease production transcriptional regulator HPr [Ammoniphilus resinae]